MAAKLEKFKRMEQPRVNPVIREPGGRLRDFREVYLEYDRESAIKEASRCVECKVPPCEKACKLNNHIRDWLVLTSEGRLLEAAALSRSTSNMPEVCGRICPQDRLCEGACILRKKHETIAIGHVERFINEYAFAELKGVPIGEMAPASGRRVAVVGAGPASLACAEELRKKGHEVTVFEVLPKLGGWLLYGIPSFKLEKWVVERRVEYLRQLGVQFVCNIKIGQDRSLQDLFDEGFDAIFLGTGAQKAKTSQLPGLGLKGVHEALPFLVRNNLAEGKLPGRAGRDDLTAKKVAVFGGGDTAMYCLRTSVRLGAAKVICVYRRDEENMPGSRQEVKRAKEEGVTFHFLTTPVRIRGDEDGQVRKVECMHMQLGETDSSGRRSVIRIEGNPFELEADIVILAFGFQGDPVTDAEGKPKVTPWLTYGVDKNKMTSWRGIFAGGDGVRGADVIGAALRDGREAAVAIDQYVCSLGVDACIGTDVVLSK